MRRRDFIAASAAATTIATAPSQTPPGRKGRLKQSAMTRNFNPAMPFEDMCREAARLGLRGFDTPADANWPILRKYGLIPTLSLATATPLPFRDGIVRKEIHDRIEPLMRADIDRCAAGGCPTLGIAGGQRLGMSYEEGLDNCVAFLNRVKAHAEDKGVTIVIEIQSRFDRPDQVCDHVAWGVELSKRVNSPRMKLLFDVYHVQVMDGDICRNIRDNFPWIGHFHAGGVPGRHEIDGTQELNYRFIAQTIADLGFAGYVGHEWTPAPGHDPIRSLTEAVGILDA
jgi:hydroxypyruvate isomerase